MLHALTEITDFSTFGYEEEKYKYMRGYAEYPDTEYQKVYEVSVKNDAVALLCVDAATYLLKIQELDWENPEPITFKIEDNKLVYYCNWVLKEVLFYEGRK